MARYGNDEGIDYFKSLTLHNFIVNLTSCHYHQVEESCSNDNEDCCCSSNVQEVAILRGGDDDIGSSSDEDEEGLLNKRASPLDDHPLDFDAVPEELDENALSEYFRSSDNVFFMVVVGMRRRRRKVYPLLLRIMYKGYLNVRVHIMDREKR